MLKFLIDIFKLRKERLGHFYCEIGDVNAERVSNYGRLEYPLHNFAGDFTINCSKMNMKWKDDGGCFSCQTNVPGTCLASPQEMDKLAKDGRWYDYKWCRYLPGVDGVENSYNNLA